MRPWIVVLVGLLGLVGTSLAREDQEVEFGEAEWKYYEVDEQDGKFSRKGQQKGSCKRTGPKPSDNLFKKYTRSYPENKCPCWWDLTRENCACCKEVEGEEVMQCGWPMHKFCYKKSSMGCPGVCNNKYTQSGKGFPCYSEPHNLDCAWCTETGFQCAQDKYNGPDSKFGSRCQSQTNQKYCKSVQGDCRHIQGACPADRCIKHSQPNKYLSYYKCECPEGYTGNGIQCVDSNGDFLATSDVYVELVMSMSREIETFPFTGSEITPGVELQSLIESMENVETSCSSGGTCSSTFNQTETNTN